VEKPGKREKIMDAVYRRLFPNENKDAYVPFQNAIARQLTEDSRLLDVGCGDHQRLAGFRTPRRDVWGTDFHVHPHLQDQRWFRLLAADGRLPFAAESFDIVTSCWVLEHVSRPEEFLSEVARVLRPGGVFISLTPYAGHYVSWLARAFHLLPHWVTQKLVARLYRRAGEDTFPTYYRLNTLGSLRTYGTRAGLRLGDVAKVANPDYFHFSRLLCATATTLDWVLEKIRPGMGRVFWVITMHRAAQTQAIPAKAA
jgi:SAM-dependent methyltransferase